MSIEDKKTKVTLYDSFDKAKLVWQAFEKESDCYAFQNYNWLKTWYDSVGVYSKLKVCIVLVEYPAGEPLMLLPLGVGHKHSVSSLLWLGGTISDYHAPLLRRDCSEKLTKQIFSQLWTDIQSVLPPFDIIWFEKIPEFVIAQRNPFLYLSCTRNASNAHHSHLIGTFENFLNVNRSKKSISTEKRKQRKLKKQGNISFKIVKNDQEIKHFLDEMIVQKSRSYTEMGVPVLFNKPGYRDFFKTMTEKHIHDGFVHMSALTLNGRILAVHWGLLYKKRFYHLFPSYEKSELTKFSPGNLLLWNLLEWCIENKIDIYDFTAGDESYKNHWSDTELKLYDYYHSKSLFGLLYISPLRFLRVIKRKIKHSPFFWRVSKWVRARFSVFS